MLTYANIQGPVHVQSSPIVPVMSSLPIPAPPGQDPI